MTGLRRINLPARSRRPVGRARITSPRSQRSRSSASSRGRKISARPESFARAFQHDHAQVLVGIRIDRSRMIRFSIQHVQNSVQSSAAAEQAGTVGQQLVQDRTECMNIDRSRMSFFRSRHNFRGHIAWRADDDARLRQLRVALHLLLASPKSVTYGVPSASSRMFPGFKSRCRIPCL